MVALAATSYIKFVFKSLNINEAVKLALEKNAVKIERLNLEQLHEGIDSTGYAIEPFYKPYTIKKKQEKGQPFDRVTLKDTGDFYEGVYLKVFKRVFDIRDSDPKTEALTEKYGKEILGLTEENIDKVAQIIKPDLEKIVIDQLRKIRQNATKESVFA